VAVAGAKAYLRARPHIKARTKPADRGRLPVQRKPNGRRCHTCTQPESAMQVTDECLHSAHILDHARQKRRGALRPDQKAGLGPRGSRRSARARAGPDARRHMQRQQHELRPPAAGGRAGRHRRTRAPRACRSSALPRVSAARHQHLARWAAVMRPVASASAARVLRGPPGRPAPGAGCRSTGAAGRVQVTRVGCTSWTTPNLTLSALSSAYSGRRNDRQLCVLVGSAQDTATQHAERSRRGCWWERWRCHGCLPASSPPRHACAPRPVRRVVSVLHPAGHKSYCSDTCRQRGGATYCD